MTFERDGTVQMTAQVTQTTWLTWHCQGRYEIRGDMFERNFLSCRICPIGGSCSDVPLTQIPGGAKANFPISFPTPTSVQIDNTILFADQRK
jgi:hypothetical protein